MIKQIAIYVILGLGLIISVNNIFSLRSSLKAKELEISSLKETQASIIQGYEDDIKFREQQASKRQKVVEKIVKVHKNDKCIKSVISSDIIKQLQY